MSRRHRLPLVAAVLVLGAACITVNVIFPEAAIKDLSKQIEEQVRKEAAAKAAEPKPPEPPADAPKQSSSLLDSFLGVSSAYAQDVAAPEVSSPAIRKIIESRASRLASLNAFKTQGAVGENNQGLLEVRSLDALSDLKARAELQRLVRAENADREELYKAIAAAKGVDASQISKIRETYAATLRDNAKPGEWIQKPDGAWAKK